MALPQQLRNRLSVPVVGAPLFIISGPELVIAQCQAGIVGSFPALNARPADQLEVWLQRINEELDRWNQTHPDRPAACTAFPFWSKINSRLPMFRLLTDLPCSRILLRREMPRL